MKVLRYLLGLAFGTVAFYILQMNAHLEILFQNTYHYVKQIALVTGVFEIFFGIMLLLKRPANWLKTGINLFLLVSITGKYIYGTKRITFR